MCFHKSRLNIFFQFYKVHFKMIGQCIFRIVFFHEHKATVYFCSVRKHFKVNKINAYHGMKSGICFFLFNLCCIQSCPIVQRSLCKRFFIPHLYFYVVQAVVVINSLDVEYRFFIKPVFFYVHRVFDFCRMNCFEF